MEHRSIYKAINESAFDVAEIYHSMQNAAEDISCLAYRYNTGIFLILTNNDDIQDWLKKLDYNQLPPVYSDIIAVYGDVVEHYINNIDGGMFSEFDYEVEGFDIKDYLMHYSQSILRPSDRLIVGPEEGTFWYARTIWEAAENTPVLELNTTLVRQLYDLADKAGIYDEYEEHNFYNAESVVDIKVPIIATFNPHTNWYDILDGYHRLYKARWTNATLFLKSIDTMPEPDFKNAEITEQAMERYVNRRTAHLMNNFSL